MEGFVLAAEKGELAPGQMKLVNTEGSAVLLLNVGGELYAIDNECPHAACDLAAGTLDGDALECHCHGSRFNVKTGAVENPPALESVATYVVRIEGDHVFIGQV